MPLNCVTSLYILDSNPLSDTLVADISSRSVDCLCGSLCNPVALLIGLADVFFRCAEAIYFCFLVSGPKM